MAIKKLTGSKITKKVLNKKVATKPTGLESSVDGLARKEDILEMQSDLIREISVYIEKNGSSRAAFAQDVSDRYDYLMEQGYPKIAKTRQEAAKLFVALMDRYDLDQAKKRPPPKKKTVNGVPKKYSYLVSILSGFRHAPKSDPLILKIIAWILGVPTIQIYMWSGQFDVEDLIVTDNLDKRIAIAYESMACDPSYSLFCPTKSEWSSASQALKLRFIMTYEFAAGQRLLESASLDLTEEQLKGIQDVIRPMPQKKVAVKKR